MSEAVEQIWHWLYYPLQQLKEECRAEPNTPWEVRREVLLQRLGAKSVDQHPVLWRLADYVAAITTDEERTAFLSGAQLDGLVYQWAQEEVGRRAQVTEAVGDVPPAEPPAEASTPPTPEALAEVTKLAVQLVVIPALTDLARTRRDLLAGVAPDELNALCCRLVAGRLVGSGGRQS